MAIPNKVKQFRNTYGEGWAFDQNNSGDKFEKVPQERKPDEPPSRPSYRVKSSWVQQKVDLSKFDFGRGLTLDILNFGPIDPLFAGEDGGRGALYWGSNPEFIMWVVDAAGVKDKFFEKLGIEPDLEALKDYIYSDNAVDAVLAGPDGLISSVEGVLCGVTDDEYFKELVVQNGYGDENVISLG